MARKPANFEKAIQVSGLSKKEIAYRKNVKPATLSRHLSGAIPMTLDHAYEYAEILGCLPQDILFPLDTIPVVINNYVHNCRDEDLWSTSFTRVVHYEPTKTINAPSYFEKDMAACLNLTDEDYRGGLVGISNTIDVILHSPIKDRYVHHLCQQKLSYVCFPDLYAHGIKRENSNVIISCVYSQPDNKYTLYNPVTDATHNDVELEWATPICGTIYVPEVFFNGGLDYRRKT